MIENVKKKFIFYKKDVFIKFYYKILLNILLNLSLNLNEKIEVYIWNHKIKRKI